MAHVRIPLFALLTFGFVVSGPHGAAAQTPSPDEKAVAAYTLTMPTVKKVMAVMLGFAEEAAKDPKAQELAKVKAQIETLNNKEELTEAEQAELEKLNERQAALDEELDLAFSSSNDQSLAGMEAAIRKHPAAMRLLAREGLTPREYALTLTALLQATLIEGFSQGKVDFNALPGGANPENVRFVQKHKAELEAMQKAMAAASKK